MRSFVLNGASVPIGRAGNDMFCQAQKQLFLMLCKGVE